jgi:hypothetical protein
LSSWLLACIVVFIDMLRVERKLRWSLGRN